MKRKEWSHSHTSKDGSPGGRISPGRGRVASNGGRDQAILVERVLAGDTEAYRPLVEAYERGVYALARRLLGQNDSDAEDMTQETFVRAFEYLGTLEDRKRFGPWLFRIARSLCRDRLRRLETERRALRHRLEELRLESIPPGGGGVRHFLSQLPPEEYQALRMRYFEGWTYDEIASRMGLTFSQVDHLLRKARARLARKMDLEKTRGRAL